MMIQVTGGQADRVDLAFPGLPACFVLLSGCSDSHHAEGQGEDRQRELGGSCREGVSGL